MKIVIDAKSNQAIYEQIMNQLRNAILTGELSSKEALPSIRVLASQLEVSVITTKRAYEELEKQKLIQAVAGKGFYVCDHNLDYLKEKQYVLLEQRMTGLLEECLQAGMKKEEIQDMVTELLVDMVKK